MNSDMILLNVKLINMKTFPTLYKRTKTGAIQEYNIEISNLLGVQIIKRTGQLGGKLIEHREIINVGKNIGKANETTPEQQAILQAESDWKRKQDEGYKSLEDLDIVCRTEELALALDKALPQFNTDASGNVKPMLAKAVDWNKVKYPCYVQPKLDGVRCLMILEEQKVTFLSRSGKEYNTLSHIGKDVEDYVGNIRDTQDYRFVLDGEIYSNELSFQSIVAAVKKQRPDSLLLKFRAYDIVNNDTQQVRTVQVFNLAKSINSAYVEDVNTHVATCKDDVKRLHDGFIQNGYEGAMIRHFKGIYGQGQRSSDLLKVKEFDETEFAFKNFEFGQRGVEDLIAVCWVEENGVHNGLPVQTTVTKEFRAKMIGTKAEKEALYAEGDIHEGQSLTVKHFGWTDDGLPRFPIGKAFRNY